MTITQCPHGVIVSDLPDEAPPLYAKDREQPKVRKQKLPDACAKCA